MSSLTEVCMKCQWESECEIPDCNAIRALAKICKAQDLEERRKIIREYAKELGIIECEVSDELRQLGERVIARMPELYVIRDLDVKIGYVMSYKAKKKDGKTIAGECEKVTGSDLAFLPFQFVVTFYEPNISYMTQNQKQLLMLHELRHIGLGPKGLRIEPHSTEDFRDILERYGLGWTDYEAKDIPDILAEPVIEKKEQGKKKSRKG